jgi:uncharacterized membrane protein
MTKKRAWLFLAIVLFVAGGAAYAFEQAAAPTAAAAPADGSTPLGKRILFGALGGVMAALIGWAKNRDDKTNTQETLSIKYMAITVAIGAIVGAIAGALGKTLPDFFNKYESLPVWGFAMMGAEALLKALGRQSIGLAKFLGIVKAGAANPTPPELPKPSDGS